MPDNPDFQDDFNGNKFTRHLPKKAHASLCNKQTASLSVDALSIPLLHLPLRRAFLRRCLYKPTSLPWPNIYGFEVWSNSPTERCLCQLFVTERGEVGFFGNASGCNSSALHCLLGHWALIFNKSCRGLWHRWQLFRGCFYLPHLHTITNSVLE